MSAAQSLRDGRASSRSEIATMRRRSDLRHRVAPKLSRVHPPLQELEHPLDAAARADSRVGHRIESRLSSLERRLVLPASDPAAGVRLQTLRIGWRERLDDPRLQPTSSFSMAVSSRGLSRLGGGRRASCHVGCFGSFASPRVPDSVKPTCCSTSGSFSDRNSTICVSVPGTARFTSASSTSERA